MAVICVYGVSDIDYEKNGAAILSPTSALVTEEAGGSYELTLTHPVDKRGVWSLLVPGNILKAAVPAQDIESAISGENVDIWRITNRSGATVYAKPSAPVKITYTYWSADSIVKNHDTYYPTMPYVSAGVKCTYKATGQNYQCVVDIMNEAAARVPPPSNSAAWKEINNYTKGSAALTTLPNGEEFYLVSTYSSEWLYIQTRKGIQGYVQKSACMYVRTEEVEETGERAVSDQLFRIYESSADGQKLTVTVKARHVSYDLAGNLIQDCAVNGVGAASALARIRSALLFDEECTLATNLTDEDGLITCDYSWKNPISALLDPDTGIVDTLKAKLIRDNWDLFINKNTEVNRGLRLAYGTNLTGVTWTRDSSNIITRVVPVAQNKDGSNLLLEEVWVDSPLIDSYPVIRTEYLKLSQKVGGDDPDGEKWTVDSLREYMRAQAENRFSVDNVDKISVELTVRFTLLGNTREFKQYKNLERLSLYDTIRTTDPVLNLDISLQVASYSFDPINERFTEIKLGSAFMTRGRDVSGYNLVDGCIRYSKLSQDTILAIKEAIS